MRDEAPRRIDQPEPGYFRMRLVGKGPYVAARISRVFGFWSAEINGQSSGPIDFDPTRGSVFDVWTSGERIDENHYNMLLANPPAEPHRPIPISMRGMAEAMREQDEQDWWATRPIR